MAWNTVRVFISSTFRDMHAERDHLVRFVFPRLREQLLPYRIQLVDVDLRWGIPVSAEDDPSTIRLCLKQIDACRPYFLAILGDVYGTVPCPEISNDSASGTGPVTAHAQCMTEMEIHHAIRPQVDSAAKALFFFRDPAFLETVDDAARSIYSEQVDEKDIAEFGDGSAKAMAAVRRRKLDTLKDTIRAGRRNWFLLDGYPCEWNADVQDTQNDIRGQVSGLDSFGNAVADRLKKLILDDVASTPVTDSPQDSDEAGLQKLYVDTSIYGYIPRPVLESEIDRIIGASTVGIVALVGPEGVGKSTQICRWIQKSASSENPPPVVMNFVSASGKSTDLSAVLMRFTEEFASIANIDDDVASQLESGSEALQQMFDLAGRTNPVILVVDNVERVQAQHGDASIAWLPKFIPPDSRILLTVDDSTADGQQCIDALKRRSATTIQIGGLSDDERRTFSELKPSLSSRSLLPGQLSRLLGVSSSGNALFLETALEELRIARSYKEVDRYIDSLPQGEDALLAISRQILVRLREDCPAEIVDSTVAYIALAMRGLRETELADLVATQFGEPARADLFYILRLLRSHLERQGDRLSFREGAINDAAKELAHERSGFDEQVHAILAGYFLKSDDVLHRSEALAHLFFANKFKCVAKRISDPKVFVEAVKNDHGALRGVLALLEANSDFRLRDAYANVISRPDAHEKLLVAALAETFDSQGDRVSSAKLWVDVARRDRAEGDTNALLLSLYQIGHIAMRTSDYDKALEVHREGAEIAKEAELSLALAKFLGAQGAVLSHSGNPARALELYEQSSLLQRELSDRSGLAVTYTNIGSAHQKLGDWQQAVQYYERAEKLLVEGGHPANLATCLYNQANIYWQLSDNVRVLRLLDRADELNYGVRDEHGLQRNTRLRAQVLAERGEARQAIASSANQIEKSRKLGDPVELVQSLLVAARIHEKFGHQPVALDFLTEAREVCDSNEMQNELLDVLGARAGVLGTMGNITQLTQALAELERMTERLNRG